NTLGPTVLASLCRFNGARLVMFSSDLVFDGTKGAPYTELDAVAPLSTYGRSKVAAEQAVLGGLPEALVIRTGPFFGPWDRRNFLTQTLHALERGERVRAAADTVMSPSYVPDLVHAALDLLLDGAHGLWHLSNQGAVSWMELVRTVALMKGLQAHHIEGCDVGSLGLPAARPRLSVLESHHGVLLPTLEDALERYLSEREQAPVPEASSLGAGRSVCGICRGMPPPDGRHRCEFHL
ncbi:MAG TPA: sugar nucleotide-binding protein, partial [Cystobacter sp.]